MQSYQPSLRDHLTELRGRLLIVVAGFLLFSGIGYLLRDPAMHYLIKPLNQSVYFTTPQGGFDFLMRVIMTIGFIGAVPLAIFQLLRFIEPAIARSFRKKFLYRMFIWSVFLTIAGVLFGYFLVLPTTLHFFSGFGGEKIQALISANDYLTMVLGILATFAFIFQLPLIISIIDHIHPLTPDQLTRYRRHVFVGSLVLAVILPFTYDPLSQFIMAAPIILLYEASVLAIRINHRPSRAQKKQARIANLVEALRLADQAKPAAPSTLERAVATEPQTPSVVAVPQVPAKPLVAPARQPQTSNHVIDLRSMQPGVNR